MERLLKGKVKAKGVFKGKILERLCAIGNYSAEREDAVTRKAKGRINKGTAEAKRKPL